MGGDHSAGDHKNDGAGNGHVTCDVCYSEVILGGVTQLNEGCRVNRSGDMMLDCNLCLIEGGGLCNPKQVPTYRDHL